MVADAGDEEGHLRVGVIHDADCTNAATASDTNTGGAEGKFDLHEIDHYAGLHFVHPQPPQRRLGTTLHFQAHENPGTVTPGGGHGATLDLDIRVVDHQ